MKFFNHQYPENESPQFIFSKVPCFQHILLKIFRRIRWLYENFSLKSILFQTLKQHLDYKSVIAKTFGRCYLGNKEQKAMFLVMSRLDVHFAFERPFFCVPIAGAQVKFCAQKIGRLVRNLSTPATPSPWAVKCQKTLGWIGLKQSFPTSTFKVSCSIIKHYVIVQQCLSQARFFIFCCDFVTFVFTFCVTEKNMKLIYFSNCNCNYNFVSQRI